MDRRTLDHSLVRRLLEHIEHRTTDMADDCLEVPCENYTSPAQYQAELDTLFFDHPLVLCMSGALPKPGSYLAIELCGIPVLLSRDGSGQVHAMLNSCRHRGARLVDGCGQTKRFTCPFHAWNYGLQGELTGLPVITAFKGMCRNEMGLIKLPVDEGYGLVVGRLRPGPAVHIDDYLGAALAQELALLDVADWEPTGEPHVHHVEANWKSTLDTYRENYHFDFLHANTLKDFAYGGVLTFDAFGHHLRNCSAVRTIDALRDVDESEWQDVAQHFTYQYALFPNTSLTVGPRHLELWQILPSSTGQCQVLHTAYLRPDLSQETRDKATEQIRWICEGVVDKEDFWVAGRCTGGMNSGLLPHVLFGRNEPALQHLHRGYAEVLQAAREKSKAAE